MNIKKIGTMGIVIGLLTSSTMVSAKGINNKINSAAIFEAEYIDFHQTNIKAEDELRATWISTVYNLDFPSKKALSKEDFKKEYMEVLNNVKRLNLNTIIFQVRPKGDTFYPSKLNPWSEFLTGTEGKSPNWDPLEWMIDEAHKKDIKFEAWFNPYRVTTASNKNTSKADDLLKLSNLNYAKKNPDKVFKYDGKLYLNPGENDVVYHITNTIMEVVENYDIDGVHLDDYFYPSKRTNVESFYSIEEENSFKNNNRGFTKVSDWRRDNVNLLVDRNIKTYNKNNGDNIVFGISPFGIWGHESNHPKGSKEGTGSKTPVSSMESYNYQFADTRKWVKENMIDYIAPQIYWTFDEKAAPYGELVNWWSDTVRGTEVDLYIGHANYKQAEPKVSQKWTNEREISNQMKYNKDLGNIKGSIFFRYKSLLKGNNPTNDKFIDILSSEHYKKPAASPNK